MSKPIKNARLEQIDQEMTRRFDKTNSTKSHRDAWLIARLCEEIIHLESRIDAANDAQAEMVKEYSETIENLKRQIRS